MIQQPQDVEKIRELINLNPDSRQYFYVKADERWLNWLWANGFLDIIKQKAEDTTRYGFRTPEINYLVKVAEKQPTKVVDIMLDVPISIKTFNPEVVDRFLHICSTLPAPELKRIVKKIHDEKWTRLMGVFSEWGFEYEKILQTLTEAADFDSALIVAETVLSVRTIKEAEENSRGFSYENPFYFNDLSHTKVFEYLLKVDEKNVERSLALLTDTMSQVVIFGAKEDKDEVFSIYDSLFLIDADFFTLELNGEDRSSHRDDVKNLAAALKDLAIRTIGKQCENIEFATNVYNNYFAKLPDSRSMWRLRLFVLSLCPETFKNFLKESFFRLFKEERYHELISGTEYQKTLRIGFSVLPESDKREYVKRVIEYFLRKDQEKESDKENWHIKYGSRILSMIAGDLTANEQQTAKKAGFTIDPDYEPEPSIGTMRAGTVVPRGPINQEEFGALQIADITKKLQDEWTPEKLGKQNTSDDFLHPLNAEGVGELLRIDIAKRLQDYISNANLFFQRNVLDQHYTYSFLRGVQEVLRENKTDTKDLDWENLITLCITIKKSGEAEAFDTEKRDRDTFDAWLSGWTGVHSAMTDVLQELLRGKRENINFDFAKYRDDIFTIISYLLAYPDPLPEDEEIETASMKTKTPDSEEYLVSDPYSMAINTVRGRAFEAFSLFIYKDDNALLKEEKIKISADVKELYGAVLKNEQTRALMFMFGHYLPSFYFRDKEWMQGLFSKIFPPEASKKHLYTAAWEGFLSTNLYEELFFSHDIQALYERGLILTDADYSKQKHFKDPDEGVAIHMALAFMHFPKFTFEYELFKKFWDIQDPERHKNFISFIGRHSISRGSAAEWMKNNKVDIEKLKSFWDWALDNCTAEELTGFGFWINAESTIFDTKWLAQHTRQTLEKTKGYLEREYELMRSLSAFAKESPEDTLAILRAHLLEEVAKHDPVRTWLHLDNEVFDAFKELYNNEAMKEGVRGLINDLLPYRGGLFWALKSILENNIDPQ